MKIAYIAPEIPGLSSTFVYNEIFEIESCGAQVLPFSIHKNIDNPADDKLRKLKAAARRVYGRGARRLLADNLWMLRRRTGRYLATLRHALGDAFLHLSRPKIAAGILYRCCVGGSVARELIAARAEHVHAHFAHFPADIAMYSAGMAGIPFSVTAHANDIFCNHWLLPQKVARSAFFLTISDFNRRYLADMGCDAEKIRVIRCGISFDQPHRPAPARSAGSPVQLGFLGRLVEKKGLDTLLRACGLLQQKGRRFILDVAGNGPLMAGYRTQAAELGLSGRIRFLGDMNNADVAAWLQTIDIFVLPCRRDSDGDMDGIPVALMEAMSCGKPVIATRLSGIPELVIDNVTGLLAAPGDAEDLAARIDELLLSQELMVALPRNAQLHVGAHYNNRANAAQIAALFRERIAQG